MSLNLELTDHEKLQNHPHYYEDDDHRIIIISDDEMEDEEEEAPSLCDLPVSKGYQDQVKEDNITVVDEGDDFDFDFDFNFDSNFNLGSQIGSRTELDSEMCTADEIFSGGQLLPFRHPVRFPSRSLSRSESMDRLRFGSRSSSTTSSTSSSSSSYNNIKPIMVPNPKVRNQFHSYPSPNPRVRASGTRLSTSSLPSANKSTMWQVLRLGLVRTPEIEVLQSRTSHYNRGLNKCTSSSSSNSNSDTVKGNNNNYLQLLLLSHEKNSRSASTTSIGGIFKSCKCSVGAIEPTKTSIGRQSKSLKDQILNEDKKLAQKKQEQRKRQNLELRQGKQAVSHHRTFEWLRDLSHASVLNS